jgi:alpha-tubulin suppressor-like RCC1 family protein
MLTRAARFRARIVVCVVLLGGATTLGLACGASSHARTQAAHLRTADSSPISAGGGFTCTLLPSHRVKCWGWNDGGQLGDSTTTNRTTPVSVVGLP